MTLILPYPLIILKNLAGCAVPQYETDMNGLGEFPRIHQTVLILFCSVDLGITKLITLSEERLPSQQFLSQLGIKHEIHGCVEFEGIPVAKIVKIIESIENEIAADGKVAVHCREHKYMTSEDFRGFGTIYHINHTAIRFCLTIRISIFNDVISLPILTDKNTFQTKANN